MRRYNPSSKPLAGTGKAWEPSDPDKAYRKNAELTEIDTSLELTPAPSTSHLEGFIHYDRRKKGVRSNAGGNRSAILVRFRATKYSPASDYLYLFSDHSNAAGWFRRLKAAPRPGQLIPNLQEAADRYHQRCDSIL